MSIKKNKPRNGKGSSKSRTTLRDLLMKPRRNTVKPFIGGKGGAE